MSKARSSQSRWRRVLAAACVAACMTGAATAAPADADPADLWWNPAESGWGMQLVHGGSAVFATLFVYDAMQRPTFYTATLAQASGAWSGPLYATTGPAFAAPVFDLGQVTLRIVGTLTFTPVSAETATLQYAIDGAAATKSVQRQLLRVDDFAGRYALTVQRVTMHCADAGANGDRTLQETMTATQAGALLDMEWTSGNRVCRFNGGLTQAGSLAATSSAYTCSDGEEGTMAWFELTKRNGFIAGRFQGHGISNGCDYRGQFTGLVPA